VKREAQGGGAKRELAILLNRAPEIVPRNPDFKGKEEPFSVRAGSVGA
jgi:hypothetical protein